MSGGVRFSIILPVCHGGNFLQNALRSIDKMYYPPEFFEVLVTVQADDRKSQAIIRDESSHMKAKVTCIETDKKNRSAMLNGSINAARGRVLVFADDDCIFLPDWLKKIESVLEQEPNVGVIGGQDIQAEDESSFNLALDYVFNSFIGTGGLRRGTGRRVGKYYPRLWNMAIPREIADSVSPITSDGLSHVFNESLAVHEDVELASRIEQLSKRIVYAQEVRVLHSRDTTLLSFTSRSFNMARTSRSIGVHRLPHVSLAAFSIGIITLAILSIVSEPVRIILGGVSAVYVVILLVSTIEGIRRSGRFAVGLYVPLLLIALHFSRGIGYLFSVSGLK